LETLIIKQLRDIGMGKPIVNLIPLR
jgi:hypothetical protein